MRPCPPCFEVVRFDSSFTLAMAASRRTSTSNGMIVRPSSGSVRLERSHGFPAKEINRLAELIEQHESELLEKWNEFFGG